MADRLHKKQMMSLLRLRSVCPGCMCIYKVLRYMQKNSAGNFYINDYYNGLHPNQTGHFRMGTALAGFLNSI